MAIERNRPVDRLRLISCDEAVRVLSGAHNTIEPPDAFRLAIQEVDRLHLTGAEDRYEEMAHCADVLDLEDEPVRRCLSNVHSVDGFARKVIDLFKVEHLATNAGTTKKRSRRITQMAQRKTGKRAISAAIRLQISIGSQNAIASLIAV